MKCPKCKEKGVSSTMSYILSGVGNTPIWVCEQPDCDYELKNNSEFKPEFRGHSISKEYHPAEKEIRRSS